MTRDNNTTAVIRYRPGVGKTSENLQPVDAEDTSKNQRRGEVEGEAR